MRICCGVARMHASLPVLAMPRAHWSVGGMTSRAAAILVLSPSQALYIRSGRSQYWGLCRRRPPSDVSVESCSVFLCSPAPSTDFGVNFLLLFSVLIFRFAFGPKDFSLYILEKENNGGRKRRRKEGENWIINLRREEKKENATILVPLENHVIYFSIFFAFLHNSRVCVCLCVTRAI